MEYTANQIAQLLHGIVEGDSDIKITTLNKIEEGNPGGLAFLANPKYLPYIYDTKASIVLVNKNFVPERPVPCTLVRVDDAYSGFAKLLEIFQNRKKEKRKTSYKARVSRKATIGKNVLIGDFVVIGDFTTIGDNVTIYHNTTIFENCTIGSNVLIYSNVSIMDHTVIGNNCMIQAGAVIGSDGFGFAPCKEGGYTKIPQTGNVLLEDDVEIGANTCIDRATIGSTIIKKGTKIDNMVQVAHNCEIGENSVIAGQCGFAGSTKIGNNAMMGGQVGIAGHLKVGNNVKIAAQSGVMNDIADNMMIMGAPGIESKKERMQLVHIRNLDKLYTRVQELEKELQALKAVQINKTIE